MGGGRKVEGEAGGGGGGDSRSGERAKWWLMTANVELGKVTIYQRYFGIFPLMVNM